MEENKNGIVNNQGFVYCKACGGANKSNVKFCEFCGKELVEQPQTQTVKKEIAEDKKMDELEWEYKHYLSNSAKK